MHQRRYNHQNPAQFIASFYGNEAREIGGAFISHRDSWRGVFGAQQTAIAEDYLKEQAHKQNSAPSANIPFPNMP
ncbi:transferrin-binding protein-like solute binding protein [Rappaport israeli]|uniref:transferrin-binding protein-like solute binding protein n=1 Tax=Rappaport israeli TaxID=1839807 RepID=UPI00093097C7|nr:transferrin-binding protein-like solute binding protein [Rappaport israeli]